MANPKVHICGHPKIYVPDDDCSECIRELQLFKDEVHNNYYLKTETYTKLEVDELIAGVSGGGGFKLVDELPATGENGYIYLVPIAGGTGYEQYIWTDSGWVDIGREEITLDKASILTALGYEETTITMTATDGTTATEKILVEIQTP